MTGLLIASRSRRRLRRLTGLPDGSGRRRSLARLIRHLERHPRRLAAFVAGIGAMTAGVAAGPVAAVLGAVYAAVPMLIASGRRRDRSRDRAAAGAMDLLATIAADLRAGADPAIVIAGTTPSMRASGREGTMLADRVAAAVRVAEITGARLADVLDRLETDARGLARARGIAIAQATGAEATAWLLAALPIAGIALGYGIGADPLRVLLHTRIGAVCALAAVSFQITGLVWSRRLIRMILDVV